MSTLQTVNNNIFEEQMIGDIILVSSKHHSLSRLQKIKPFVNYFGQKVGTLTFFKNYIYTHAILVLSKGLYIESTGEKGVVAFSVDELINRFKYEYNKDFIVMRNTKINTVRLQIKLFERAEYYYEQKYNCFFILPFKRKGYSYCSELISNIYNDINLKFKKPLYATWPIHLLKEFKKNKNWKNITVTYKNNFKKLESIKSDLKLKYLLDSPTLLVNLFTGYHKYNDTERVINQYLNNYSTSSTSFYYIMYKTNNSIDFTKINTEHELRDESIDFDKTLNLQKTMFGRLKSIIPTIKNYIEEKDALSNINDEDIKKSWKDTNSKNKMQLKISNKVNTLIYLIKESYKINLQYNSNFLFFTLSYQYNKRLSKNQKSEIKNYLSKFCEEYPINENILDDIIQLVQYNNTLIKTINDTAFIEIINRHTLSLRIIFEIYFKYLEKEKSIFNIVND